MPRQKVWETFWSGKSEPTTKADLKVGKDLQDTLQTNRAGCVGMAANIREGKVRMRHAGM